MERVCFVLQVRAEKLEEYKARHQQVWPEMLHALREAGWTNYSLFLRADGMLVGYVETPDFAHALSEMAKTEVNGCWQKEMAEFFVIPSGAMADQAMLPLEEVFHLE